MEKRNEVLEIIKSRGYEVNIKEVVKNNVAKCAIIVKDNESNMCPAIYVDEIIEEVEGDLVKAAEIVIALFEKNRHNSIDVEKLFTADYVKDNVRIAVQKTGNENLIKRCGFIDELEEYLLVVVDDNGSFKVTTDIFNVIGIDKDTLFEYAERNTFAEREVVKMADLLGLPDMFDVEELWVVSNKRAFKGAICGFDKKFLDKFKAEHGFEKVAIIPSSIHEVLLMPYKYEENMLNSIINTVNSTYVREEDILFDRIIMY